MLVTIVSISLNKLNSSTMSLFEMNLKIQKHVANNNVNMLWHDKIAIVSIAVILRQ